MLGISLGGVLAGIVSMSLGVIHTLTGQIAILVGGILIVLAAYFLFQLIG